MPERRSKKQVDAGEAESPNRFSRQWYEDQPQREKKWFENIAIALFFLLLGFAAALVVDESDSGYYRLHGALLMVCIFFVLLLLIRRSDIVRLFQHAWRSVSLDKTVGLMEIGDALYVASLLIVVVSILFVIDLSFFENYGLRIGAVAAVALFSLLRTIIQTFHK